jgi:TatA/E family protein of Tat protein translocase
MPGFPELLVIIIILIIVFGAKSLPDLGEAIGRAIVRRRAARAPQAAPASQTAPSPAAPDKPEQR